MRTSVHSNYRTRPTERIHRQQYKATSKTFFTGLQHSSGPSTNPLTPSTNTCAAIDEHHALFFPLMATDSLPVRYLIVFETNLVSEARKWCVGEYLVHEQPVYLPFSNHHKRCVGKSTLRVPPKTQVHLPTSFSNVRHVRPFLFCFAAVFRVSNFCLSTVNQQPKKASFKKKEKETGMVSSYRYKRPMYLSDPFSQHHYNL